MDETHPAYSTFSLLANETRLQIITALGDASGDGYATLSFSELQEQTGIADNGKFNYHLKKLVDEFVDRSDDGYSLTLAGIRVYQAIEAHAATPDVTVDPFEIAGNCDACGGGYQAWYEDGRAYVNCVECGDIETRYPVDSRRIDEANPESVVEALDSQLLRDYNSMFHGVCPYCNGETTVQVVSAGEHWDETGMIEEPELVHAECTSCSWFLYASLAAVLHYTRPVQGFHAARGYDVWATTPLSSELDWTFDSAETEPPRIYGHFSYDGDRLDVVVDDDMTIVEYAVVEDAEGTSS